MRRLTVEQYRNVIGDILGDEIVVPTSLEPDSRVEHLFALGSTTTSVSPRGVEQYEEAAFNIAAQAMELEAVRERILPCDPSGTDDLECVETFVRRVGRRLWRRPLTTMETEELVGLHAEAVPVTGDFHGALQYPLAAMLQSPAFLYRVEVGSSIDPADPESWRMFTGWEMAERLSFFLWNSAPDDALLDAAGRGDLEDDAALAFEVDRMLDDERARRGIRAFFDEMLQLDLLDHLNKDPTVFGHYSPEVGPAAREETLRLIEHLVFEVDSDYRELFTTRTTFIDRKLASIYAVPAPTREGFGMYEYPEDSPRQGILGHLSILAPHANESSTSATKRGAFLRETLLCGTIPEPPADVNTTIPSPSPTSLTLRDRVGVHLEDPFCAGCHQLMDPLGLALENFDALGRYQEDQTAVLTLSEENAEDILAQGGSCSPMEVGEDEEPVMLCELEVDVDTSGELDGESFDDALELGRLMARSPQAPLCLTRTMYRYATGHIERVGEEEPLKDLNEAFAEDGYRVLSLIREIVLHPAFRMATPPRTDEPLEEEGE